MTLSLIEVIHSSYVMLGSNRCYSLPASAPCWTVACSLKYSHSLSSPVCPPSFPPVLPVKTNKLVVQRQTCRYCTAGKETIIVMCWAILKLSRRSQRETFHVNHEKSRCAVFTRVPEPCCSSSLAQRNQWFDEMSVFHLIRLYHKHWAEIAGCSE